MSNKILCEGCGKVYPLWIAADAKPANCSECGTQVKQRQGQPVVQPSTIVTPVSAAPTKQTNWGLIFFNSAIIGTAFLLIISIIGFGIFLGVTRSSPTVAGTPPTSPSDPTTASTDGDPEDDADARKATEEADDTKAAEDAAAADKAAADKAAEDKAAADKAARDKAAADKAAEAVAGDGVITDVSDEDSLQQAVGLVQIAMAMEMPNDPIKHMRFLWKTVSAEEFKRTYDEEKQEELEEGYPTILGDQLVPGGGAGTCFLVSADGFAITNLHVVDDYLTAKKQRNVYSEIADRLKVDALFPKLFVYLDGIPRSAEVVYNSNEYDFALLKIDSISDYPYFQLSSTEGAPRKTKVTALGFPASSRDSFTFEEWQQDNKNKQSLDPRNWFKDSDLEYVATSGEISKSSERDGHGWVLQHTATVDQGSSGGPLVTNEGIVLGINSWQRTRIRADGGIEGVGLNLSLSMHSLFRDIRKNPVDVKWVDILSEPSN
jgi:S1-C subfamily serine protease